MSGKKAKVCQRISEVYGFMDITVSGQVVPQCMMWFENQSNDALRPSSMQFIYKQSNVAIKINLWLFSKQESFFKKWRLPVVSVFATHYQQKWQKHLSKSLTWVLKRTAHHWSNTDKTTHVDRSQPFVWGGEHQKACKDFFCWYPH